MQKKIYFVIDGFPAMSETFVINQIVAAIESNYKIRILANGTNNNQTSQFEIIDKYDLLKKTYYAPEFAYNKLKRISNALLLAKSSHISFISYLKSLNIFKFKKQALNFSIFYQLLRIARHRDADIYHAQFGPNGYFLANMKALGLIHGKIITTFHGYDLHYSKKSFLKAKEYYSLLFQIGDLFTVNTPYLLDQLLSLGCSKEKVVIMPMGVDTNFFIPFSKTFSKESVKLISVGRLIKLKGHKFGIKAVHKLVERGYKVEYNIVGDGPEMRSLYKLVDSLNLKQIVKFHGALPQLEIRKLLQQSDFYLMTSITDETGRRESQGVVTAEAQACGLPVICFNSGGVPYTIKDNYSGFVVPEGNVDTFVRKITNLIDNEKMRVQFQTNARAFVLQNYSLGKMNLTLRNIYSTV